ncbi:MAG: hypothetical protein U0172_11205 [Nitrospiraceae bacterium]
MRLSSCPSHGLVRTVSCSIAVFGLWMAQGCTTAQVAEGVHGEAQQEHLGRGIVVGSLASLPENGAGEVQQEHLGRGIVAGSLASFERAPGQHAMSGERVLVGQVVKLEGGAYVVRESSGREWRVPHDENTHSDRPAHVGDAIQVGLDHAGRALHIANVDQPLR